MLSALFKAFTGRAGGLGSLLVLLIVALIAYTVVDRLPKVEQNVLAMSQDYLDSNMVDADTLMSLQAEGRDIRLGGEFQNPAALKAGLESLEGVRRVFLIGSSQSHADALEVESKPAKPEMVAAVVDVQEVQEETTNVADEESVPQTAEVVEAVTELLLKQGAEVASGASGADAQAPLEVLEAVTPATPDSDKEIASEQTHFEESLLELRYDGTQVKLSGHVGDDKMAELLVEAVRQALPSYSILSSDVDGNGKASPLNWMRRFLRIVAGLPEDAQGLIRGSDSKGVSIVPDEQQTLNAVKEQAQESVNESREASPARVVVAESSAPDQVAPVQEVSEQEAPNEAGPVDSQERVQENQAAADNGELTASSPPASEDDAVSQAASDPSEFIVALNKRLSDTAFFRDGEADISAALAQELDQLVQLMQRHPSLYLRIVGNVDSNAGAQFEEFVGIDRARQVQKYLRSQQLDGFRVVTAPLPRGYAFDKRVQLVFYISE